MNLAKQSTARTFLVGPVLDADGVAKTDEVVGSIKITKNGTVGAADGSATLTHDHAGKYKLVLTANDFSALGLLEVSLNSGTNDMPVVRFDVVPANVYDSLVSGSDLLDISLKEILGTALTETAGQLAARFVDFFNQAAAGYSVGTALSAFKATGFSTHTAVNVRTEMDSNSTQLVKIGTIPALDGAGQTIGAAIAKLADDNAGADFDATTDSQQAIRDRGDAAWTTGAGGSDRLLMVDTTISGAPASQTEFDLAAGSADDDAYSNCTIIIEDVSTATQKAVGMVINYTGATKTVFLKEAPIFTIADTDKVYILAENSLKSTAANRQLNVSAGGVADASAVSAVAAFFQDCFTVDSGEVSGAEVSGSLILEIVKVAWDRVLTGATHNIPTSAGRRLRAIQEFQGYEDGAIWIDTVNGSAGTTDFENGTVENPVNTIADANTLAASLGISKFHLAPASSITFAATQANQVFTGERWTLALGGQSVSGSAFFGANVSGIGTGASEIRFGHCHLGNVTLPPSDMEGCVLTGTFTIGTAGNFFFEDCKSGVAGTSTPVLDFGSALNSSNVNFRSYSGGVEIQNMGAGTGTYNMSLEGWGQLIVNANCSATSTVTIRGHFTVTDNASGAVTLSEDSRFDVAQTNKAVYDRGVWIDTNASNTNTASYVDGTPDNPVSTLAAATTIAGDVNSKQFYLVPGSSITLAQAYDDYIFNACHSTIALGGQSVNNAIFHGAVITGNDDGSNVNHVQYFDCVIGTNTLGQFVMTRCYFTAILTLAQAGSYFLHQCFSGVAGTSTPTLDFGSGLNASNINMRDYSGGIEITNMGAGTGSYNMSLEGNGQLIINANCSATSTVAIRGNFTVTDNAGGAVTLSDEARFDVTQITGGEYPLDTDANGRIRIVDGSGAGEINTDSGAIVLVQTTTTNTDMVGTDGANTTVPDAAGTAPTASEINAEVVDVIRTDTTGEPGQGEPPEAASLSLKLDYIYKAVTNLQDQTATLYRLYNRAGDTVDQKATVSDDSTTATRNKLVTGP